MMLRMFVSSFHQGDEHADRRSTRSRKKIAKVFQHIEGSPLHRTRARERAPGFAGAKAKPIRVLLRGANRDLRSRSPRELRQSAARATHGHTRVFARRSVSAGVVIGWPNREWVLAMAMRETERSLRWYFVLAGAWSCVSALRSISTASELPALPASWTLAVWFPIVSHLVLGAAFVLAGLTLTKALADDPTWIKRMLIVAGIALVVELGLVWMILGDKASTSDATVFRVIGLAITAYLYVNVQRLSNEAKASPTGTVFE
jgi:hypothetical protein